jgi:hypothetical protein
MLAIMGMIKVTVIYPANCELAGTTIRATIIKYISVKLSAVQHTIGICARHTDLVANFDS